MKNAKKILSALLVLLMLFSVSSPAEFNFSAAAKSSVSKTQSHEHKKVTSVKKATLSKNGTKTVKCSDCGKVLSQKTIFKIGSVSLKKSAYTYTGKAVKPTVTVKNSEGKALKTGTDYTVSYKNNKNVGKATVTVTFKGDYSGTKKLTFSVLPKIKVSSTKNSLTVSWTKVPAAKKYKISLFKGKKLIKAVSTTKTSSKFDSLSPGTGYTVKLTALNGKKVISSSEAAAKTLSKNSVKAYRTKKYLKVIASGTFIETSKVKWEGIGTVTTTVAAKNGNRCKKTTSGGETGRVISRPLKKGQKYPTTYVTDEERKVYAKVPEDSFLLVTGGSKFFVEAIAPTSKISAVKVKKNGKTLVRESFEMSGDIKMELYFDGETPVFERIHYPYVPTPHTETITKFSSSVPDSLFEIPKNFTRLSFSEFLGAAG